MRRILLLIAAICLPSIGCDPPPIKPSKPTERAGGVISGVIDKTRELVTMTEMHDLYIHMYQEQITGSMPTTDEVRAYAKKENTKLSRLLESGAIVLTGTKNIDDLWAYERDAPTNGGWIIMAKGETKLSADEVKKLLGK